MAKEKDWDRVEGVIVSYDRVVARGLVRVAEDKSLPFAGTCFYGVRGQKRPIPGDAVTVVCREGEQGVNILAVCQQREPRSGAVVED